MNTEVINGNNFESYTVSLEVKTTHDFAGHTSIHGIGNIFDSALGIYDRLIWLAVCLFHDRDKILRYESSTLILYKELSSTIFQSLSVSE